jgi:hypothetical protein
MRIKEKVLKLLDPLIKTESIFPMNLIGVKCDFDEDFMPFMEKIKQAQKNNLIQDNI